MTQQSLWFLRIKLEWNTTTDENTDEIVLCIIHENIDKIVIYNSLSIFKYKGWLISSQPKVERDIRYTVVTEFACL